MLHYDLISTNIVEGSMSRIDSLIMVQDALHVTQFVTGSRFLLKRLPSKLIQRQQMRRLQLISIPSCTTVVSGGRGMGGGKEVPAIPCFMMMSQCETSLHCRMIRRQKGYLY